MEFDKSRVYTALTADELQPGDIVIVADTITELKGKLSCEFEGEVLTCTLNEEWYRRFLIGNNNYALAYLVERKENCTNCGNRGNSYCSCFIRGKSDDELSRTVCGNYIRLSEPRAEKHIDYNHCEEAKKACVCAMTNACPEKHYRPFRDIDELIKVWIEKSKQVHNDYSLTMPYIWVLKKDCDSELLITGYNKLDGEVLIGDAIDLTQLFDNFTFLDGSVCGVEE